ncbi:glutathione S-transferase-like [Aethina tumida]|uniref:glutathione S-transferase-like n=1 Tax=Aethina tumida TaxID=116153 RepID=UPI0021478F4A|nr:glutathione S-transferase-like [Aethina tumida]
MTHKNMTPALKITYFDITGLAEPARWLLSYGKIDFEDHRITHEEWPALKNQTPFGQLPLLECNGKTVSQSVAITRYVAKLVGLTGKNDWEDLEIDSVVDTINELKLKFQPYGIEKDEEKKQKLKEIFLNESVPFYLSRLDERVKNNEGYLVGGHLTWADVYISSIIFAFKRYLDKDLLEDFPTLKKLQEKIIANKNIQDYLITHPLP